MSHRMRLLERVGGGGRALWVVVVAGLIGPLVAALPALPAAGSDPEVPVGQTRLVSPGVTASTSDGHLPALSDNGRYGVFRSGDALYWTDVQTGGLVVVNERLSGGTSDAAERPSISDDGCLVAFDSGASDLVPGDTNGLRDVFVRDMCAGPGPIERVSLVPGGVETTDQGSANASLSGDGSTLAFTSPSSQLVPSSETPPLAGTYTSDVFVLDLGSGSLDLVSNLPSYISTGSTHYAPGHFFSVRLTPQALSDDGSTLVFGGSWGGGGLDSAPCSLTNQYWTAYAFAVGASAPLTQVWPVSKGCRADPVISGDGSTVMVRTRTPGGYEAASPDGADTATVAVPGSPGDLPTARISVGGGRLAFVSGSAAVVAGDTNGAKDVFTVDWPGGPTARVSVGNGGVQANGNSSHVTLSAGQSVLFGSRGTNLSTLDTSSDYDYFARGLPPVTGGGLPAVIRQSELDAPNPALRNQCPCQGTAGDPVNTQFGNQYFAELPGVGVAGRGPGLGFSLGYNSAHATVDGPVGFGWTHSYGMQLSEDPGGTLRLTQETGATVTMIPQPGGGWDAPARAVARAEVLPGGGWRVFRNHFEVFDFDADGRLVAVSDLHGNETTVVYAPGTDEISYVEDPAGRRLEFVWSGGRIVSVTSPRPAGDGGDRVLSLGYAGGDLTSYVDVEGGQWTLTYDTDHLLETWQRPRHAGTGVVGENSYDAQGRVSWQEDELDRRITFSYDTPAPGATTVTSPDGDQRIDWYVDGLREKVTHAAGTADEFEVSYTYDPVTLAPLTVTDGRGKVTTYGYDAAGNRTSTVDPTGRETRATFNALDQPTLVEVNQAPPGQPADWVATKFDYDATGNVEKTTEDLGGPTQAVTDPVYGDPAHPGDVTSVVDARGETWSATYDPATGDRVTATDPLGHTTSWVYDSIGRVTATVTPEGNEAGATPTDHDTTFTRDDTGRVVAATDPVGDRTEWDYDANGNLVETRTDLGAGDNDPEITRNSFDAADQLTLVEDISRVASVETVVSATGYGYHPDGARATWTNGNGATWSYAYDHADRLSSETDPNGQVTGYGYDNSGNLTAVTQPGAGSTCAGTKVGCVSYGYDDAGRPTGVDYSDPATPDVGGISYDGVGRRLSAQVAGAAGENWSWDRRGRLTATTDANGRATGYGWDPGSNLTSVTYPGQTTPLVRAFDDAGRLVSVTDWTGRVTNFGFDANSNWTNTVFPSGTGNTDVRTFDRSGNLTGITWNKDTTVLGSLAYTPDNEGMVDTVTATGDAGSAATDYGYDPRDQLTAVNADVLEVDPAGNLTTTEDGRLQVFDPAQQLCWSSPTAATGDCVTPAGDATTYDYDARGNRTASTFPSGTGSSFSYDAANRLTEARVPDAGISTDGQYKALTPGSSRVADSTSATAPGTCGPGACVRLTAGQTVTVAVTGVGNMPATGAVAVTGTVTAVNPGADGTVSVNPTGGIAAATVAYATGADQAGSFTAKLDANGRITLATTAATDVYVDITGYYTTPTFGSEANFWPMTPAGVADTRAGVQYGVCDGGVCSTLSAGQSVEVTAAGVGDVPATGASAVVVSVTAVNAAADGRIRVAPNGAASAGTVTYEAGQMASGVITAPVNANGTITVTTSAAVDVVVSVSGWYATPTPGDLGTALDLLDAPTRVADTRAGTAAGVCDGGPCTTVAALDEVHVAVAGQGGVPGDAAAAVVNISVWNPAGDGLAFVARDPASFNSAAGVFYTAGEDTSMAAVLPVAEDGTVSVLATTAIDLTIDVVGVFTRPVDTFTYTYDSTGLRTAKQAGGASPVEFSWGRAGGLPLLLAQHRGAAGTSYLVYGPGGTPIYQIRADGSPLFFHQDHLGSTRLVTVSNGNTYGTMTYDAYGKVLTNTTPWYLERPLLTYAGQYTDTETGFQYLRARYHDPATGQFLTRDPLTHQTGQPYAYAAGNPINFSDPSGAVRIPGTDLCIDIGDPNCNSIKEQHSEGAQQVADAAGGVLNGVTGSNGDTVLSAIGQDDKVDESSLLYQFGSVGGSVLLIPFAYSAPAAFGGVSFAMGLADLSQELLTCSAGSGCSSVDIVAAVAGLGLNRLIPGLSGFGDDLMRYLYVVGPFMIGVFAALAGVLADQCAK